MKTQWIERVKVGCARLWPHPLAVGKREMLISSVGAGLGLMLAGWISHFILGEVNLWFIAPMGASAVLLFGVPNSPLAQPTVDRRRQCAGGDGGCLRRSADPRSGPGLRRCGGGGHRPDVQAALPASPGGAVALTAILGGPGIHQMGYHFVLYPVLLNSVLLAALAILFNNGRATLPARAGAGGGQTGQSADRCRFHHPRRSARGADGGICSILTRTICRRSCCAPSSWRISGKARPPDQTSVLR